jgi:hypothetical protein
MITMEFPALFQRALLQCGMYAGGVGHAIAVLAEQRGWWLANLREDGARAA